MSLRTKTALPAEPVKSSVVAVPRIWLIAFGFLIVAPWLVAGLYLWWPSRATPSPASATDAPSAATSGPWGTLILSPIVISPPVEFIRDDWARRPDAGTWWFMPGMRPEEAGAFLSSTGLSREQVSRLLSTLQAAPKINGFVLTPDQDLVRGLAPDVRARLYVQLAKSMLNADQVNAFRYASDSTETWLGPARISPARRDEFEFPGI